MKSRFCILAVSLLAASRLTASIPIPFVYQTEHELFGSGDFDGDGRTDVVIVDKETGRYRLAYQLADGILSWQECRPSGNKGLAGLGVGHMLATNFDALVFAAPDAGQVTIVDVSSPTEPSRPVLVPFTDGLGPNSVVPIAASGKGLLDLFIGSMYNSPDPGQAVVVRNDRAQFAKLADVPVTGIVSHGNRVSLKPGQPDWLSVMVSGEKGDTLLVENATANASSAIAGLPSGSDYAFGKFAKGTGFIVYQPGSKSVTVHPVEDASAGKVAFGKSATFDLGQPVKRVVCLDNEAMPRLLVIFGAGETASVFDFDGSNAPKPVQAFTATNELFTCAAIMPKELVLFLAPSDGTFSTRYRSLKSEGGSYTPDAFGGLPTLADNDNITIPDIHARISANWSATNAADMKALTNFIPGTKVPFVMVPIPGGEFLMGSPDNEAGRKPDEGPQHRVRISPFWMGQCEVTWNEYELFMYPDEEHRMRETMHSDEVADKLADAVTHPSKPYVEMSFGMGKDGFPAISMTQHAANKYCQWLSAKTGQFYRLPTEAEWEYSCRAGTTTPYFFGSDTNQLANYAWFEDDSDFKYQKVRKKKPNPWGLYDMSGNVVEWVLDQYSPDYYQKCAAKGVVTDPWNKATQPYPHSVRGGSWDDGPLACRSAARRGSDRSWKMQDPQLPKSVWYHSDAQWVGFRVVHPLKVPSAEQMQKYWTSGVEKD